MNAQPILLIHGFNSGPEIWYDSGFAPALIAQGGLDEHLVRPFLYGQAPDGAYDNRGDVAILAQRLAAAVGTVAADALAAGGPGQVTLIGHSLGGLIARYYLSCAAPDALGTCYAGDVARLITLGTPHTGAPLSDTVDLLDQASWIWRLLGLVERLPFLQARPASLVAQWQEQLRWELALAREEAFGAAPAPPAMPLGPEGEMLAQATLQESEALRQIQPDSEIIARINAPGAMPLAVAYHLIYGNVGLTVEAALRGRRLFHFDLSLGDGAVPAASASRLPNAPFTSYEVPFRKHLRLEIGQAPDPNVASGIGDLLPYALHTRLYADAEVQAEVLRYLASAR
ncbi:MAG: alpha/beta fold hydrolase [Caldilineales bacterium]|nr:alpha/beta fold hydrolase [Caldilineales bacterium]